MYSGKSYCKTQNFAMINANLKISGGKFFMKNKLLCNYLILNKIVWNLQETFELLDNINIIYVCPLWIILKTWHLSGFLNVILIPFCIQSTANSYEVQHTIKWLAFQNHYWVNRNCFSNISLGIICVNLPPYSKLAIKYMQLKVALIRPM